MRCKVGDLAYIAYGDPVLKKNVGRIVRVVAPDVCRGGQWWIVESEGESLITVSGGRRIGAIQDRFLIPIRGEHEKDVTEREKELTTC